MEGPEAREARHKLEKLKAERSKVQSLRTLRLALLILGPAAMLTAAVTGANDVLTSGWVAALVCVGAAAALVGAFMIEALSDAYYWTDLEYRHKIENKEAEYFTLLEEGS